MIWTPALDGQLTRLWADHANSTDRIADLMQLTRNQVMGRVSRLKLPKRGGNEAAVMANKRLAEQRNAPHDEIGCRFIRGEPASFNRRCGKPVAGIGESWCAEHKRIVWQRAKKGEAT